tara:strand:+ start:14980 stop:15243 length:264 start_codon:yes stop_codon:yes gene_type:complete
MADADAILLEMVKGLRHDVVTIRDNHLAHIADDIQDIKSEQAEQRRDIDDLKEFKNEIDSHIKTGVTKLVMAAAGILAAAYGIPLAL